MRAAAVSIFLCIYLFSAAACSSSTPRKTTTTTVERTYEVDPIDGEEEVRTERTVTIEEDEEEEDEPGLIGSVFGLLWDIIAFPFRLLGEVLDLLF